MEAVTYVSYRFNEGVGGVLDLAFEPPDIYHNRPVSATVVVATGYVLILL